MVQPALAAAAGVRRDRAGPAPRAAGGARLRPPRPAGAAPAILALIFLFVPRGPNTFAWPWGLLWAAPAVLVLMIVAAWRLDSGSLRFVLALRSRISGARYYRDLGVVVVFDNKLVLQQVLGLQFYLFFSDSGEVLAPTPEKVYSWFWHSSRMRWAATTSRGEGSVQADLQQIRDATGARSARIFLTERPKPLTDWPEVHYCNSLWLMMSHGVPQAERIMTQLDELARFLSNSESLMNQAPWPLRGRRKGDE